MDVLHVQNVLGKITHGLIGFDLHVQGEEGSKYLNDFLALKDDELDAVFKIATANMHFLPGRDEDTSKEKVELEEAIRRARDIAQHIDAVETDDIICIIHDLCGKMGFLYESTSVKSIGAVQP